MVTKPTASSPPTNSPPSSSQIGSVKQTDKSKARAITWLGVGTFEDTPAAFCLAPVPLPERLFYANDINFFTFVKDFKTTGFFASNIASSFQKLEQLQTFGNSEIHTLKSILLKVNLKPQDLSHPSFLFRNNNTIKL